MKKLIAVLLFLSAWASATTITGTVRGSDGNRFTGTVKLYLSQPAQNSVTLEAVLPVERDFTVDNGLISSSSVVVPNDQLQPQGTYYVADYYDVYDSKIAEFNYYVTSTNTTWDVGQATPTTVTTQNVSYVNIPYTNKSNIWSGTQTGKFLDQGGSVFNVSSYGAKCDGITNDTAAFAAASTAALAFQVVSIPSGTCLTNITINSGSNGNLTYRGRGRRTTFLKPAANAPVLTIDSTSGPVQSVTVEDLGFDNTSSGFAVPAVQLKGTNINDWHLFRRLFMTQFTKAFNVIGRTIWTKLDDVEILSDASNGIDITTSGAVNRLSLNNVRVAQSVGKGLFLNSSSPNFAQITISDSNFEFNGGDGITACNVDAFDLTGSYIENNTGNSITFPSTCTYARGLHIAGNYIWGALTGNEIVMGSTIMSGSINGNFIAASGNTFVELASWTTENVYASGNHDSGPHSLTPDANSQYHLSVNGSAPQLLINSSGTLAPSVFGVNAIRFTNTAPLTVTNFTGGDPGQSVEVVNEGSSTVAFSFSNTNGFFIPTGGTMTLPGGQSARFFLSTFLGRWLVDFENGPLMVGSGSSPLSQFQLKNNVTGCTTPAVVGGTCTTIITWDNAFADALYQESCGGSGVAAGVPTQGGITARSATTVTFQTVAATAVAAQFSSIECAGWHR